VFINSKEPIILLYEVTIKRVPDNSYDRYAGVFGDNYIKGIAYLLHIHTYCYIINIDWRR